MENEKRIKNKYIMGRVIGGDEENKAEGSILVQSTSALFSLLPCSPRVLRLHRASQVVKERLREGKRATRHQRRNEEERIVQPTSRLWEKRQQ